MASEDTELPSRHESTIRDGNPANAASPVSSTDARSARRSQAKKTNGTGIADSSDPYVAFLEETFNDSDPGYVDVLRWFDTWKRGSVSSWTPLGHEVYKCFDFCPSPGDEPRSLITTTLHGPINQDTFKIPAVNGVLRVIIVETTSESLSRVMNDAGVHFKLPPYVFAPFTKARIGDFFTSWFLHEMYAEPLIFRVEGLPIVVQQVAFPGSKATDMTCILVLSRAKLSCDLLRSLATSETDPRHMVRDAVYAIARLWIQSSQKHVAEDEYKYANFEDADFHSRGLFQIMAELDAGSSALRRWLLIQGSCETDLEAGAQSLLYRVEHQRVLDATQRVSQKMQLRASILSIEESKRGIEQSKQVGRLTQLAFVFIPLTFVTGVFGMNITQFGGQAPLWKFWVTAGTTSGIAFIIGLMTVWSDLWARLQRFGPLDTMRDRRARKRFIKRREAETNA